MSEADYIRSIQHWRAARHRRLLSPTGWLTLVDRIILSEGDNEIAIGTVRLREGVASLRVRPGLVATCDGTAVTQRVLRADENGPADVLSCNGRTYELLRRGSLFAIRVKDPASPTLTGFRGLDHFPIDSAWRIAARFDRYDPPRFTEHQYDIGGSWKRPVPGLARFSVAGRSLALEPVLEDNPRRLFFVFGDETNRRETYPAGRFLYADFPSGDEIVLDFNTAFNPPCAFTAFATCPLPPSQNRLPIPVVAGELRYG